MKNIKKYFLRKVILSLTIISIFLATCTKDVYAPSACFEDKILPIFVSKCSMKGCHNTKDHEEGYDLTTYEGIMRGIKPKHPLLSEIYNQVRGKNPSMPPEGYSKLTAEELTLIKLWINSGAKRTSNCTPCDTSSFAYTSRVSPILVTWCTGCHNSANSSANIDLSNYNGVVSSIQNSRLIGSITHSVGFSPMPQNAPQLSACEIRIIEKWVAAGYPNN